MYCHVFYETHQCIFDFHEWYLYIHLNLGLKFRLMHIHAHKTWLFKYLSYTFILIKVYRFIKVY